MAERLAEKQAGILSRIDGMGRRAQVTTLAFMTSLALGGGAFARPLATALAKTGTPSAQLRKGAKSRQIQEFVKVNASGPGGEPLGLQKKTFAFVERCKDDSKPVSRTVIYSRPEQPLGRCDIGSPVKVTQKQPLQGSWIHRLGTTEKIAKATSKNNHRFVFEEQMDGGVLPGPAPTNPAQAPTPTPTPTPIPTPVPEGDPFASGNVGVDISWAQCGTADETPSGADFGIVDVNAGLGYSTNPCLKTEADNFPGNELNLYVNTAWNDQSSHINPDSPLSCEAGDEDCLAYNYGYNAGAYAIQAATDAGVPVNVRWAEDVEPDATWSNDTGQNRQSLLGERDALLAGGATNVMIYSTTAYWQEITDSWQNDWESWGATTWTTPEDAETYCMGHEFTGGPSVMMQYLPGGIDHDVAC